MSEAQTPPASIRRLLPLSLLITLIVPAAVLRVLATHNDLWLDELISLRTANEVKSLWQIFSAVHSDNNHYLTTVYMYFVRGQSYEPVYRYLSVAFGVCLIPAGYWLLERRSRVEAVIFAALLTCSYPLIHFSSEARGYSGSMLGTVLAYAALTRCMAEKEGRRRSLLGLVYGLALSLAILSQLTACLIWLPLAIGSLIILMGRPERRKSALLWIEINLLPAGVLAGLYLVDLWQMTTLGGPPISLAQGLMDFLWLVVQWPAINQVTVLVMLVALLGLIVWQLALLWKAGDPSWILLALIYVMPPVCMLFIQPSFFPPRYFLVIVPFIYVSAAMVLARLAHARIGRLVLAMVLALFVARQAYFYVELLRLGRGQYTAGLQYMVTHSPSQPLRLASNQDFRAEIELNYFAPRVLGNQQFFYVTIPNQALLPADWFIFHGDPPGPVVLHLKNQPTWYRVAYFGSSTLSGQTWTIYSHKPMQ